MSEKTYSNTGENTGENPGGTTQEHVATPEEVESAEIERQRGEQRKMVALIDRIEQMIGEKEFDIIRQDFWPKFAAACKEAIEEMHNPDLVLSFTMFPGSQVKEPLGQPSHVASNQDVGHYTFMKGVLARDVFHSLERRGLVGEADRELVLMLFPAIANAIENKSPDMKKLTERFAQEEQGLMDDAMRVLFSRENGEEIRTAIADREKLYQAIVKIFSERHIRNKPWEYTYKNGEDERVLGMDWAETLDSWSNFSHFFPYANNDIWANSQKIESWPEKQPSVES